MRVLSGITPSGSGRLHIGNYFGAIRQFVDRQNRGDENYIFVADWHALTSVANKDQLKRNVLEVAAAYLALGLDPAKTVLYRQSDIIEIPELTWMLACVAPMGLLERAHAFKDKTARGLMPNVGLFTYPILMAADILIVRPDVVPVGRDQKQHIEIARDLAVKFNESFGETFHLPEHEIPEAVAVVPGTDGEKMSKSYGNTIDLFGSDEEVRKQIMSIKTDSTPLGQPLSFESPVFKLLELLASESELAVIRANFESGSWGYGHAKQKLLELFHAKFDPARARFQELIANPAEVEQIFAAGAEKARIVARATLADCRHKVGLE